jgi:hypothetical protein
MSQCLPGCDMAAANRTICRKPSSCVANRTSAAIFTAGPTAWAYIQQIINLPHICRHTCLYVAILPGLRHIIWLPQTRTSAANWQVMSRTGNLLLYWHSQTWQTADCKSAASLSTYVEFCRNVFWVATYRTSVANWNICRKPARYVANRKSAAILTQPNLTHSRL